jgi:hypothetical protein
VVRPGVAGRAPCLAFERLVLGCPHDHWARTAHRAGADAGTNWRLCVLSIAFFLSRIQITRSASSNCSTVTSFKALPADLRPRNHLCHDRRRATHRMNYDTPSLRGSCWGYLRTLGGGRTASMTCGDQGFLGKPRDFHGFGRENRLCRCGKQRTLPTSAQPLRRRRDARNPSSNRCSGSLQSVAESEITRCHSRRLWLIFLERARKLSHCASPVNPIRAFAGNFYKVRRTQRPYSHRSSLFGHSQKVLDGLHGKSHAECRQCGLSGETMP